MPTLGDLLIRVGADLATFEALKNTLGSTATAIEQFASSVESMAIKLEANVTAPIEAWGEALNKVGEQFKFAENAIILGTGAMGDQLASLDKSFESVFSQVNEGAVDVAGAIAQLATKLDLAGEPLEHLTKLLFDLHDVTGEQVGPLVQNTAKMFAAWSVATDDQSAALDHLMQVAMASATSVGVLEENLQKFGPAFREMGLGLQDVTDLIGNLEKSGINVEPALMGIQRALNSMTKAGLKDPLEGLQLLFEKIQNAKTEGQAFGIGAAAFGKGAASMVDAIRSGKISLDDFAGSLKLSNRTVTETANTMEDLGQKWDNFKNKIQLAVKPLGEELVKALEDLLAAAQPVIGFVTDMVERFTSLPGPVKEGAFAFLALVAAIGPILGIVGGLTAAFEALAVPLGGMLAILGGPAGLVVVAAAFGIAIGAWAISKAIDDATKLSNSLNSLYDLMDRGEKATKDQANTIQTLEALISTHNKQLGAKQVTVSQTGPEGNVLPNAEYIKNLESAVSGMDKFNMAAGTTVGSVKTLSDGTKTYTLALGEETKATGAAGEAHKSFSKNAQDALDKTLKTVTAYKALEEEIKKLQERAGAKSMPILQLQAADLRRQVYAPTATDADKATLAYYDEIIKLNRASYIKTSDDVLAAQADLALKLKIHGLDTAQAFASLNLVSTADLDRQVQLTNAALNQILQSKVATDDDMTRATIAALDKDVAAWRQAGQQIDDSILVGLAKMKADFAAAHVDLEQAFSGLGVTSSAAIDGALTLWAADLAKIRSAVQSGAAAAIDADNAEIASLQKKASAFASIGKQMSDAEVSRLAQLVAARQVSAMTTDQAFAILGLPSQDDLDTRIELITAAYQKIADAATTTEQQGNAARAAELGKLISEYRAAGRQVTDDMIDEWKARTTAAQLAAMDIDQAFQKLNTFSTRDAVDQIKLLNAAFNKLAADANTTGGQLLSANQARLQGIITALKNEGKAASDELVRQLDKVSADLKIATMNIDDAYKTLGVTSSQSMVDSFRVATAALAKVNADAKASAFDLFQAQVSYNDAKFKMQVATGQKVDELENAQNQLAKQRLQAALNDQYNVFTAFAKTIADIYGTIQGDLADVITGAKTLGQAFADVGKQIEKALVNYVVKNLLLTQKTLDNVTSSLLGLFKNLLGVGTGTTTAASPSEMESAFGVLPGAGGGSSTGGGGGILSSISSMTGLLGVAVNALSGIVQGFQMAHLISTEGKVEENTRRADITLEGDIKTWTKAGGMSLQSIEKILWNPIGTLLVQINGDLDTCAAMLQQIAAQGVGSGGGSGAPSAADPGLSALVDQLRQQIQQLQGQVTTAGGAYGAMQNTLEQQLEAQQALVTQDQQLLDSLKANLASGKTTQAQIDEAAANLKTAQDTLTGIYNQMSAQGGAAGSSSSPTGSAAVDYSQLSASVDTASTATEGLAGAATDASGALAAQSQQAIIAWAEQILPLLDKGAHISSDVLQKIGTVAPALAEAAQESTDAFRQALLDMIDHQFAMTNLTAATDKASTQITDASGTIVSAAGDIAAAGTVMAGTAVKAYNTVSDASAAITQVGTTLVAMLPKGPPGSKTGGLDGTNLGSLLNAPLTSPNVAAGTVGAHTGGLLGSALGSQQGIIPAPSSPLIGTILVTGNTIASDQAANQLADMVMEKAMDKLRLLGGNR